MNPLRSHNNLMILCVLTFIGMSPTALKGQANWLNSTEAPSKNELKKGQEDFYKLIGEDPIAYRYIDQERDIFWSTEVWEILDLNQKQNFVYYYPTDTTNIDISRRSLFDVIINGIKTEKIKEVYSTEYLQERKSVRDIFDSMKKVDTTDLGVQQFNAGEPVDPQYIRVTKITSRDIMYYKILGMWYFDKRNGEMRYRIKAICPVAPDVNEKDDEDPDLVEMFWVYYSGARQQLHHTEVFNENNTANPLTYDHLLNLRKFSATIYKQKNAYEDRAIADYIRENALFQLEEADRIKEKILNFELDLWNY